MKKHTKTYMKHFGYGLGDFIPCELTGERCVDVHHIDTPGMGSNNREQASIEILMALTRELHILYGDKEEVELFNGKTVNFKEFLEEAHQHFLETQQPYIHVNPHHDAFDALLNTKYEFELKKLRYELT